jgi:hypothetical protein
MRQHKPPERFYDFDEDQSSMAYSSTETMSLDRVCSSMLNVILSTPKITFISISQLRGPCRCR